MPPNRVQNNLFHTKADFFWGGGRYFVIGTGKLTDTSDLPSMEARMILSPAPPKGGTHVELDPSFWTPGMPAPLPLAVVDQMKYSFSFQAFR